MVPFVPGTNSAYYLKLLFVPCKYITLQYQELMNRHGEKLLSVHTYVGTIVVSLVI